MLYFCNRKEEMMKKKLFSKTSMMAVVALTALTLLTACGNDDDEKIPQTRTVLIYMSAENSLSLYAEDDFEEIKEGSKLLTEDDQLLVWFDRAKKDELPWLARIVNGHLKDSVSIADMQISNKDEYSSDPKVFEKVLSYAYSHYPATAGYGLTLWSHATGWLIEDSLAYTRGYGVDNGINSSAYDSGYWLNMPTIKKVLEKQPHLEFIFADCCNFMCLESMYELRGVTDYIVGSPAEIPDYGAPYGKVVPEMFKRKDAAKGIMTQYSEDQLHYLPLSVVKTQELEALAEATCTVLKAIYTRMEPDEEGNKYPDMTGLIHYYNEYRSKFFPYYNIYYDAGDFVKKFATEAEYKQWKAVLDQVVVDKAFATTWTVNKSWYTHYTDFEMTEEKYHGVSMFVPQEDLGYYKRYKENVKKFGWYWATNYLRIDY